MLERLFTSLHRFNTSLKISDRPFQNNDTFQKTIKAIVNDTGKLKVYSQKEVSGTVAGLSGEAHFHSSEGVEVFNRHRQHWLFNLYVLDAMREN